MRYNPRPRHALVFAVVATLTAALIPTAAYATDAGDEPAPVETTQAPATDDGSGADGAEGDDAGEAGDGSAPPATEPTDEEEAEPAPEESETPVDEEVDPDAGDTATEADEEGTEKSQELEPTVLDPAGTDDPRFTASKISDGTSLSQAEMDKIAMSVGDDPATFDDGFTAERTLAGFNPANLISDSVFYNGSSMSRSQIASFLDGKVSKCRSGYTCLPDYTEVTKDRSADKYCDGYNGGSRESAATIIYKVAKSCDVSAKALIVILQKEQGLVTHTWPSDWRYTIAMGMACPDTSACDTRYYGFQNQMYSAARQYQVYTNSSYFSWYPVGKTSQVRYHPNASCGSSGVKIANNATAALYYYTPYQPNRAALAAGYGTGDSCSAYGNRNFYNYYTDWFGSTHANPCTVPSGSRSISATYVTTAPLNARKAPNTGCGTGVVGLDKGTILHAAHVSADGDWAHVRTASGYRWVSRAYLKKATTAQSKCAVASGTSGASGTYVVTTSATARYAPWDKCAMSSRYVAKGTAVEVNGVSSTGNWVQIRTGIGNRWIRTSNLSKCTQPSGTTSTDRQYTVTSGTAAYEYPGAKCSTAVKYWGKGTSANAVHKGTLVQATKVSKTGRWIQVRTKSGNRWVPRSDLSACPVPSGTRSASGDYVVTDRTTAYVSPFAQCNSQVKYWGTGTGHRVLQKGWVLHATRVSYTGRWIQIDTSTGLLWVRSSDVRRR